MVKNNNISTTDNNFEDLIKYVINDNVENCSKLDYIQYTLAIAEMPLLYEGNITVGAEIEVTSCNKSKPKIEVISQEKVSYKPNKTHDLNKVNGSDKIKIKSPKYYKNEEEILNNMMNNTDSN